MPCHVARYRENESGSVGWALINQGIAYAIDCGAVSTNKFLTSYADLARAMLSNLSVYESARLRTENIEFLSPITAPCRILAQGSNYPSSRRETGMDPDDKSYNTLFHKSDASLAPPNTDIIRPSHVQLLDYEVELGVVVGKRIDQSIEITLENLYEYVAGIVLAHDVTARDIQIPQGQYFKGKSYKTFCPTGPNLCLLEQSDFANLDDLRLELSVNGEPRQNERSGNMLFKPHESLSELSTITTLDPGDLLLTGSPGGCALTAPPPWLVKVIGLLPEATKWSAFVNKQRKNPKYLKPGDQVQSRITSLDGSIDLGTQHNQITQG